MDFRIIWHRSFPWRVEVPFEAFVHVRSLTSPLAPPYSHPSIFCRFRFFVKKIDLLPHPPSSPPPRPRKFFFSDLDSLSVCQKNNNGYSPPPQKKKSALDCLSKKSPHTPRQKKPPTNHRFWFFANLSKNISYPHPPPTPTIFVKKNHLILPCISNLIL